MEPPRSLRFGPFELDPRAGEIRKHGVKIHLPDQSFQILLMLIEHPGEVVLREEIRKKLWPNDTVVEFDHSINAAIKRLRSALGESADDPVYIETLAKRGYRFRGEIERVGEPPVRTISHYRVLEKLGSGGMGEVWKALDERLNREVAIKISGEQFTDRFEREARAIASLNHSNICTLHDVGPNYLVMELVEGETLAERIRRGPIPLEETLAIARQIAAALEAAHDKGIVHRDLKPGNVMIRTDGTVKVLDFGIAKAAGEESTPGAVVGTPGYMSPEQAAGQKVDKRTDIWAFGAVLYEMVVGQRLPEEPEWTCVPARARRLLWLCLEKDPNRRLRDISGVALLLDTVEPSATAPSRSRLVKRAWIAAGVCALIAAGASLGHFLEKPPAPAAPVRFQIPAPPDATGNPQISPDGRMLAFRSGPRLRVHSLESGESRDLTDTEHSPFWSTDSRFIGYASRGKLKKILAAGGPAEDLADISGEWVGAAWSAKDVIVFGDLQTGLFRVAAAGGVPVQITSLDPARHETAHFNPVFLLDGRHFVYVRTSRDEGKSAVYVGSVDARPEQQSSTPLVASNWQPGYAPSVDPNTGYLLFIREGTLMAQPFDNHRLQLKGRAEAIAERVQDDGGGRGAHGSFTASDNDILVFQRGAAPQLAWYDREGKVLGNIGEPGEYETLALSPDGMRLAVNKAKGALTQNIWLMNLAKGGGAARFTFGPLVDASPVWSADGTRIIFSSNRDGPLNLYEKSANGGQNEEILLKSGENKEATSWSRDRRFVLYTVFHPKSKDDVWVLPLEGDGKPVPFLVTEFNEREARFSPDGHWVAYTSDESGQDEVYVRSFSMNPSGTAVEAAGKWSVSNGYGVQPHWRGDGRELYYRSHSPGLMAVLITTSPVFRAGSPQPLGAPMRLWGTSGNVLWDVAPDGKRFLGLAANTGPQPYTVILNWQSGLKK